MHDAVARLQALYLTHGPSLLRYLRGMTASPEAAEDLLQETFVRAIKGERRLAEAISPQAWLFAIARNAAIDARRRRRPSQPLPENLAASAESDSGLEAMRQAIKALPDPQREALELRLRDGLSYEEIAAVLQVPLGTIRSRLHYAVLRLRETLKDE